MIRTPASRDGIALMLALLMALTRSHHFGTVPDASWAVFFLLGACAGGGGWFVFFMLEAVAIDYAVIHAMGLDFWQHYCVSPAYVCLLPAYGALWLGGSWLSRRLDRNRGTVLWQAGLALLVSEGLAYLISNGSYYWLSHNVPQPRSLRAWSENLADWYLPFLGGTLLYAVIAPGLWLALAYTRRGVAASGA